MELSIKFFLFYLIAEFVIYLISDYYYYKRQNNLFLQYYSSFFNSSLLILMFYNLFKKNYEKTTLRLMFIINITLLFVDYEFFSKNKGYNYLSGFFINLVILLISIYFFQKELKIIKENNVLQNGTTLVISLVIILQFFIKLIDIFLQKFLLETQNYAIIILQEKNIFSYFMLFSLIFYTYAFYNIKISEN